MYLCDNRVLCARFSIINGKKVFSSKVEKCAHHSISTVKGEKSFFPITLVLSFIILASKIKSQFIIENKVLNCVNIVRETLWRKNDLLFFFLISY
jgi:hypothetical protein